MSIYTALRTELAFLAREQKSSLISATLAFRKKRKIHPREKSARKPGYNNTANFPMPQMEIARSLSLC